MPTYVIADDAVLEIQEIVLTIKAYNEPAARNWLTELRKKLAVLAGMPRLGRIRDDLIADMYVFPYGNYLIFYDITDTGITVLHVVDGRQDIPNLTISTIRARSRQ